MKGRIAEVFESIQGEGLYLGQKQIFVRFFGCNLTCKFCDTKLNRFAEYEPEELFEEIKLYQDGFHSISFTGGEPLLQKDYLKEALKLTSKYGYKNYLETNGTLPEELSQVIDKVDIIAMDIKLPSSTGERDFWDEHKIFLEVASKKGVFVKTVICNSTRLGDLKKAIDLVANFNINTPFVLQPNYFQMSEQLMIKIRKFQRFCFNNLSNVRIIPQMHKVIGIK